MAACGMKVGGFGPWSDGDTHAAGIRRLSRVTDE